MDKLHPFEVKIINLALQGGADWIKAARSQIETLRVKERKIFPSGFVSNFERVPGGCAANVPRGVDGLPVREYPPTVNAKRSLPEEGFASFVVWIDKNGFIFQLDAFSLTDDKWPDPFFEGFSEFEDGNGSLLKGCDS